MRHAPTPRAPWTCLGQDRFQDPIRNGRLTPVTTMTLSLTFSRPEGSKRVVMVVAWTPNKLELGEVQLRGPFY